MDEDVASPSPTASASPTPSATPIDPCFEAISEDVNIERSWSDSCLSENRPNNRRTGDYYARFFAFTIAEAATVGIRLESDVDTYLYLMRGTEKGGEVVAQNDDAVSVLEVKPIRPDKKGSCSRTVSSRECLGALRR